MRRLLILSATLLLALPVASSWARNETSAARRDANRFILEKLQRKDGEGWQRSGQYFLWRYRFSSSGCEFTVMRENLEDRLAVTQEIPMADVVPVWTGTGALQLFCQSTRDCIALSTAGRGSNQQSRLGETQLVVPVPDDLPKLNDAFIELHRLCDDAYDRNRYSDAP